MATPQSRTYLELFIRSLLFYLGMMVSLVIWAPLTLLTFPFPLVYRFRFARQWARFNLWWLEKTCGIDYQISGLEHLPAIPGVLLVKHQSAWETLMLQKFFIPQVWVLKRELLWLPLFGWALALLKPIAIDRKAVNTAIKQVLRQGKERLREGCWVVIFPEGTRVAPGIRGRYGVGGAMLAAHTGYPIIPIAHNAGEFWPRQGFLKHPGTIQVVIGPVIESKGRQAKELNTEAQEWIETAMKQIGNPTLPNKQQAAQA